jgi:hypothetical protein
VLYRNRFVRLSLESWFYFWIKIAFPKNFEYKHKILGPIPDSPFWRNRCRHHPVFVLQHNKTNKSSKVILSTMHRSWDIQVGIFEPWDWVYFQALPSWAWAETCQKLTQTTFFMVLSTGILVLRKCRFKNLQKVICRGSGSGLNPSTFRPQIQNSVLLGET